MTLFELPKLSTKRIGALVTERSFLTPSKVRLTMLPGALLMLGTGSRINSLAFFSSAIISNKLLSIMALPEKPKLMTLLFNSRAIIAGHAIPGLEAEQP